MKFKIFSILGVALCGFLSAIATPIESEKRNELESRYNPKPYIFDPLPELKESSPITRYYHFELKIIKLSPDGVERKVWSVNGQYPGPLIHANKGDRLVVNVTNNLGDPATIHWHGIFQRKTNWYDGVPGQTQCPIPSRVCFTYNFTLEQGGTYWYHSHFLAQYVDGLLGPLIVHDKEDPYCHSYDEEYVVTLSDWYHFPSAPLLVQRVAPHYTGFNPYPDSAIISGIGQYNCSGAPAGCYCDRNVPPATYNVKKGKKYRFRIINTSAYAAFTFSIDCHQLRVVEVDGNIVKNVSDAVVTVLPIHVAQRYSVIVTANQKVDNYYIRASIMENCLLPRTPETINYNSSINPNATGILHYHGANNEKPTSTAYPITFDPCQDLNADAIRPYKDCPPPKDVTDHFLFNTTFARNDDDVGLLGINDVSFVPIFNNPTNQRIMLKEDYRDFDKNQNIYAYDTPDGCVEIILLNGQPANHPFHLHGHAFWIMAQGPGATLDNITAYNFKNPVIRDTTMVFANSHLVIRYIADNPGVWAFHCHIEWHVEMGLVAQLIERPTEFSNQTLPDDVRALCMQFNNYKKERRSTTLPGDSMAKGMRMRMFKKVK
ncbi:570_t:CDS:2 [Diversispora eburnea]|uniref:570_t:CDS:1 n=1 Tax=Diversispora eburnea TaxID=1213867 RepID=A0A9N9B819_9GLOM|nr:570_t:CDS:2 [Diversispora eburnea]